VATTRASARALSVSISLILASLLGACRGEEPLTLGPTPDYARLETRVAGALSGTLTADAPTPTVTNTATTTPVPLTRTARPTATPSVTATATPRLPEAVLAFSRVRQDGTANLVLRDLRTQEQEPVTHLTEPSGILDVDWSEDGTWIAIVSAQVYFRSRSNERNVFVMRSDGTEMRLVGDGYVDPGEAEGPFVELRGRVDGGSGSCFVCAQGTASPGMTDDNGRFALSGVPVSAEWVRAVCLDGDSVLQGSQALDLEVAPSRAITVGLRAEGQGWQQASLSSDGSLVAGTVYTWTLGVNGVRDVAYAGRVMSRDGTALARLVTPEGTSLLGVDWSPVTQTLLVGAVTGEDGAGLSLWSSADTPQEGCWIENPEDAVLSTANPAWSHDGRYVVFELREWSWWEGDKYRTTLAIWDTLADEAPRVVYAPEWGQHASEPSWASDWDALFFQLSTGAPDEDYWHKSNGDLYVITLAEPTPVALTEDGHSYLPVPRPPRRVERASGDIGSVDVRAEPVSTIPVATPEAKARCVMADLC